MNKPLDGVRVAILAADGFELIELKSPREALLSAGALAQVIGPAQATVQGFNRLEKAEAVRVDLPIELATPSDFHALMLPGGVVSADKLRAIPQAVEFARAFVEQGKPIAAICHGPWLLIEAGGARGRTMTAHHSLKTDLRNAGAKWVDEPVVVDQGLVTSRTPEDLPYFNEKMIAAFREGPRPERSPSARASRAAGTRRLSSGERRRGRGSARANRP